MYISAVFFNDVVQNKAYLKSHKKGTRLESNIRNCAIKQTAKEYAHRSLKAYKNTLVFFKQRLWLNMNKSFN